MIGIIIALAKDLFVSIDNYILFISLVGIITTSAFAIRTFHKQADVDSARFSVDLCERVNNTYDDVLENRIKKLVIENRFKKQVENRFKKQVENRFKKQAIKNDDIISEDGEKFKLEMEKIEFDWKKINFEWKKLKTRLLNYMEEVAVLTKKKVIKESFTLEFFEHILVFLNDNDDFKNHLKKVKVENPRAYENLKWLSEKNKEKIE